MKKDYQDSEIMRKGKEGLPFSGEIVIDSHAHIGPWRDLYTCKNDAQGLIEHMDYLGIYCACISAFAGIGSDFIWGNNIVAQTIKHYPEKFIGFGVINPNYASEIEGELERCRKLRMKGFKLYPEGHEYPADGENYFPVFEFADTFGCLILSHGFEKPDFLNRIAKQYKNACFIIGHGDDIYRQGDIGWKEVVRSRDNVYVSLTITYRYGEVERMVKEMGSEKILFGSDMPYMDGAFQLGSIIYAKISDEDKRRILGLNMKRILARF